MTSDLLPTGSAKAIRKREDRSTRVTIADLFDGSVTYDVLVPGLTA
jgi:hypothetical protein